ncbi:MAG: ankyrin repeat domain-containing protein [Alphaproteobacteria bacterium]|nr:ankyrin repeat domain-containing protein [Alphaproteobacteria bacterium]
MNNRKNARKIFQQYVLSAALFGLITSLGAVPAFCADMDVYGPLPKPMKVRNVNANKEIPVSEFENFYKSAADGDSVGLNSLLQCHVTPVDGGGNLGELTALDWVALNGNESFVENLLNYDPTVIEQTGSLGSPAIHFAALRGHTKVMEVLLKKKDALANSIGYGSTVLSVAVMTNNQEGAELLLRKGAKIDLADGNGLTPLHHATAGRDASMINFLLERGANANAEGCHRGIKFTALHISVDFNCPDIAEMLLTHGALVDTIIMGGGTDLHYALHRNHTGVAKVLVQHGANVNLLDSKGLTPLQIAENRNNAEMIEILVQHGAMARQQ